MRWGWLLLADALPPPPSMSAHGSRGGAADGRGGLRWGWLLLADALPPPPSMSAHGSRGGAAVCDWDFGIGIGILDFSKIPPGAEQARAERARGLRSAAAPNSLRSPAATAPLHPRPRSARANPLPPPFCLSSPLSVLGGVLEQPPICLGCAPLLP